MTTINKKPSHIKNKRKQTNGKGNPSVFHEIDKLTKRVNKIADKIFYLFVVVCILVLFIVWSKTNL